MLIAVMKKKVAPASSRPRPRCKPGRLVRSRPVTPIRGISNSISAN